ncbi:MAG: TVP38/TMEM64 family protein [Desulfatibacillum sp.]|nr:TVP38/TMEM64 family protein [Desulfatibacillum sp.]
MKTGVLKKIAVAGVLAAAVAAFFIFDLGQYVRLEYIKSSQENFAALYAQHPVMVIGAYMLIYVLVTGLSLPGALVLTLAGGALFGLLTGVIIISFASTIGATLACAVSRFLLRDWVQAKIGHRLEKLNQGIQTEGSFYLFTLRLVPAFPFWMINLAMGLTKMPLFTFYWVSQVGMLAGTIVFVNAGKELGKIDSLSGILSPGLIISFLILGVFPITVKKLLELYRRRSAVPISEPAPREQVSGKKEK